MIIKTSGDNLCCGTHALGHSIYLNWEKLTNESQRLVIDALNTFYQLDQPFTSETFKEVFDLMSYRDVQWVMSLPLDSMIQQQNSDRAQQGAGILPSRFYEISQLTLVMETLQISYQIYKNSEKYDTGVSYTDPVINITSDNTHYESIINNPSEEVKIKNSHYDNNSMISKRQVNEITKTLNQVFRDRGNFYRKKINGLMSQLSFEIKKRIQSSNYDLKDVGVLMGFRSDLSVLKDSFNEDDSIENMRKIIKDLQSMSRNKIFKNDKAIRKLFDAVIRSFKRFINWVKSFFIAPEDSLRPKL